MFKMSHDQQLAAYSHGDAHTHHDAHLHADLNRAHLNAHACSHFYRDGRPLAAAP
jgi:hypothetical protein